MAFREVEVDPVDEVDFYKFNAIGDRFVGLFLRQTKKTITFDSGSREVDEYVFRNREGEFAITANYDLKRRLEKAALKPGYAVRITYVADIPPRKEGFSPMRQFRVEVDESPQLGQRTPPPPPQPVDDDIPF